VTTIDWVLVALLPIGLAVAAWTTRRHARSVSGFLAADRCAGRYLITVAYGMAQVGVISLVWFWQQYYEVGFTSIFLGFMEGPALIIMALSGWVIYRYRQTRALTLAQFLEMRYSKRFRIFAGFVAFGAGLLNYGIFPAVAARFFIVLWDLPPDVVVMGLTVSTFPLLMVLLLSTALFFVFTGGQIAVLVTDWIQGTISNWVFLAVMVFLLWLVPWSSIEGALLDRPPGHSLVNPFDLGGESRFDMWYWVISVVVLFYGMLAWQGTSGYHASAIDAHEAKMANILAGWRFRVLMLITLVLPLCILAVQHDPAFADTASAIAEVVVAQPNEAMAAEVRAPAAARFMLPPVLLGLFSMALVGAFLSTNDTYLHSWGTILVQDVILPLRGDRPLSPKVHLIVLRGGILLVAVFAFTFSLLVTPNQFVSMFLALTGAIFFGGAGAVIIGGLYWKRGSTQGAWVAMCIGIVLSGGGTIVKQLNQEHFLTGAVVQADVTDPDSGKVETFWAPLSEPGRKVHVQGVEGMLVVTPLDSEAPAAGAAVQLVDQHGLSLASEAIEGDGSTTLGYSHLHIDLTDRGSRDGLLGNLKRFLRWVQVDLTGQVLTFWAIVSSIFMYLAVSLIGPRHEHDLDVLLHRGAHATDHDASAAPQPATWLNRLGFDAQMTRMDRVITVVTLAWPLFFTGALIVGLIAWWQDALPDAKTWAMLWHWYLWLVLVVGGLVTLWFTIGGFRDLVRLFRRLRSMQPDAADDGRVPPA
jgi:SSS family solute:Na+ symporter